MSQDVVDYMGTCIAVAFAICRWRCLAEMRPQPAVLPWRSGRKMAALHASLSFFTWTTTTRLSFRRERSMTRSCCRQATLKWIFNRAAAAERRLTRPLFGRYSSGGIYIDLQQSQRNTEAANAVATSFFSALMPGLAAVRSSGKKKSGAASPAGTAGAAKHQPLSQLQETQSQSISLPGGIGHATFSCFAKDARKSAFGQIVAAFLSISNNPLTAFFLMLSIPIMSVASLPSIRTLVANLQAHGENARYCRVDS